MRVAITRYLIAMALALLPTLASAQATTFIDPTYHLKFTLSGTNATITGLETGVTVTSLVIPNKVTDGTNTGTVVAIGTSAFSGVNNPYVTGPLDMTQATSLTSIGQNAFNGCGNLTGDLVIPNSITTIGTYAFYNCSGFDGGLTLPLGLTEIAMNAFAGCLSLTGDLVIPANATSIGDAAFSNCGSLDGTLTLPDGLKTISSGAFQVCSSLTGDLTIPNSVTTIGDYAFSSCYGFSGSLTMPEGLTAIGASVFTNCSGLTGTLTIPTGVTTIGNSAFNYCYGFTGSLVLPEGVTTIGNNTFNNCYGFTGDVTIPSSVTFIDMWAFGACRGLRSFTFAGGPVTLGGSAFGNCQSLEYIDMLASSFDAAMTMPASFSRSDYTTPLGSVPAHTVIYLPTNADPALVTAAGDEDFNFVLGGTCDWFYVQDGQDYYIPHAFTAKKATWGASGINGFTKNDARTLAAEFTTAYLPYDFTLDELAGYALGYKNNHKPDDGMDNTFVFNQVTSFAANTPYVIKGASGATFPESTGTINVPATPIGKITYDASEAASYDGGTAISNNNGNPNGAPVANGKEGGTWGIYGTTESIPSSLCGTWMTFTLNSDAKWYSYDNTMAIPQFRAFIVGNGTPATSKPSFSFVNLDGTEDTTTSIDGLDVVNTPNAPIYNIDGVYVGNDLNAQSKGLYIVNGKKVIK